MITVFRVFLHSTQSNLLKAERNIGVDFPRALCFLLELHNRNGNGAVRLERKLTGQHFIHHNADGINIRLIVGDFTARLFGADVMDRTDGAFSHGSCVAARKPRNAEVADFNRAVLQKHDILRLNVAVDNAFIVRVLQRFQNLGDKVYGLFPVDNLLLLNVFFQRDALDVFHHDILQAVAEADVIHLNNIRMGKHRNRLGFVFEAATEFFIGEELLF